MQTEKLKIYSLFGDYGRYGGRTSESLYFKMDFSPYLFERYFSISKMRRGKLKIDKDTVQKLIRDIIDGECDIVYCGDSGEALLLQFIIKKRGLKPKGFLINDVDLFKQAREINALIQSCYGEDFIDDFISSPYNHWFYTSASREQAYLDAGIKEENLHYIPLCMECMDVFFPEMCGIMREDTAPGGTDICDGEILSSGSHDRDYGLLVNALRDMNVRANIICNLDVYKPLPSENIFWHHSVPEKEFVRAIRAAKYMVVPLRSTDRIAGQMNCTIAKVFGKIVVAPGCESLSDYLQDNETGVLYKQGDAESLREKIMFVEKNYSKIQFIGENARENEKELSHVAEKNLKRLANNIRATSPRCHTG